MAIELLEVNQQGPVGPPGPPGPQGPAWDQGGAFMVVNRFAEIAADETAEAPLAVIEALLEAVVVTDEPAMTTMGRMGLVMVVAVETLSEV